MKKPTIYVILNKIRAFYVAIIIIAILATAILPGRKIISAMKVNKIRPLNNKTIVIDPGHGGVDGGTNIGEILEKNINLEVGLRLKEILIKKGANVIMTREVDKSLDDRIVGNGSRHREDLNARVKTTNDSDADMLISIHVNHTKNERKIGPIVYYHTNSEEGKFLAEHMQDYLDDISTYKKMKIEFNHDVIPGNFYVLGYTSCPGIIVEIGFISNKIDRELLLDSEHQNEIAEQISEGIVYYFKKTDKETNREIRLSE